MTAIATITMNPAVDLSADAPAVKPTVKIRCDEPHAQAGGGGINVSRVVHRLGVGTTALFTSGGLNGKRLCAFAAADGFETHPIEVADPTRDSVTVTDRRDGAQYRFVFPGPTIRPEEEAAILAEVQALPCPAFVVLSGSLPPGLSKDFVPSLCRAVADCGARLVLDGPAEALARANGAFLVKPNEVELANLAGRDLPERTDRIAGARDVIARGIAQNVLVSLGAEGALLATPTAVTLYRAPEVSVVSAVGAGDSMVGGVLAALCRGRSLERAAGFGVAAGAAAVLTPGSDLCQREDVERLAEQVTAERLETDPGHQTARPPMSRIRLELARDSDAPMGSARRGYIMMAPLDDDSRLDPDAWQAVRQECTVTRFWDGQTTELGFLIRHPDGAWVLDYDPEDEDDDEPGYRFGSHTFQPGEYVSIREHDGVMRTFRIAAVSPAD